MRWRGSAIPFRSRLRSLAQAPRPGGSADHDRVNFQTRPELPARLATARLANAAELKRRQAVKYRQLLPDDYSAKAPLRKEWEFEFIAQAAEDLGLLGGDKSGLGIGVGTEPLIFFFANYVRSVIATDLYSATSNWSTARIDDVERVLDTAPFDFPRDRVSIQNGDMRSLPFADEQFDFCWSCSSIEHVDNLAEIVEIYNEMARVLKPGGHAILTTEFCISTPPYPLPGVIALDPELFRHIVERHPGLELVGTADFSYDPLYLGNAPEARRYSWWGPNNQLRSTLHFRMAQMCGMCVIAPIGFVLRKRQLRRADWRQLGLSEPLCALTDTLLSLAAGQADQAIARIAPYLDDLNPQFRMTARRYHLDAVLRAGSPAERIRAVEDAYLAALPEGEVQEADCTQLLAFSLGQHGRHEEAAAVYRKLLGTPSALADHLLHLAAHYLAQARSCGGIEDALQYVTLTIADLLEHGVTWDAIAPNLMAQLAAVSEPSDPVIASIDEARRAGLAHWQTRYGA